VETGVFASGNVVEETQESTGDVVIEIEDEIVEEKVIEKVVEGSGEVKAIPPQKTTTIGLTQQEIRETEELFGILLN
jgi:lipoate-protein ligase A